MILENDFWGSMLAKKVAILSLHVKWEWQTQPHGKIAKTKRSNIYKSLEFPWQIHEQYKIFIVTKSNVLEDLYINKNKFVWEINVKNTKSYMLPLPEQFSVGVKRQEVTILQVPRTSTAMLPTWAYIDHPDLQLSKEILKTVDQKMWSN